MNKEKIKKAVAQVDENFHFFKTQLPELKNTHLGEFALLHNKEIIDFFESENDAIKAGIKAYDEGNFSVQQVADSCIDLGYQSYLVI